MASKKFYPGDQIAFIHWATNAPITGTVIKSYTSLESVYLVVRDNEGNSYEPNEARCSLINKVFHVG